ncbi:glycerol-3-phosphate dehydrogenase/oxidase [bacterium]|nr:glycerol-3-phosphate dehydrogenase/oxidase [bacterium]
MKEFSFNTRANNLEKLKNLKFDLLIIGGGITGAGVARDAALRGLKVALVEASDFAEGTSSRSSKLVHGGIRYLENFEFHLVFEALSERSKLFKIAPHLVHPLRFMIPLFTNSRVGPFLMGLGMMLYDALALFRTPQMHEKLNKQKTLERMPIVRGSDLVGSCVYSDAYMDDDRLVHETMRSANEASACIVNYTKVLSAKFKDNKVQAVEVVDSLSGQKFYIECEHIVSTVGPWTDIVGDSLLNDWKQILRPTKGIHLTLPKSRLNLSSAVVMGAQQGNRIVFAIPRHEMIIIGTTDTDFSGDPSKAEATFEDVEYLLEITNDYFPEAKITHKDIISSYVGVRPLVKDESGSEGKTSREHTILSDDRGFTFVAGGKYTTYRLMSEQIVDRILKTGLQHKKSSLKKCQTTEPLNKYVSADEIDLAQAKAQTDIEKKLTFRYGAESFEIIQKYGNAHSYWQIEAYQAIHKTMCLNLVDFYTRRVPLMLAYADHGLSHLNEITQVFKKELKWSDEEARIQCEKLNLYIQSELRWLEKFIKS